MPLCRISPGRSLRSPGTGAGQSCPGPGAVGSAGADPRSCRLARRHGWVEPPLPRGQAPLAGRSLGPHGTAVPLQRLCRCLSLLLRPLCRSAEPVQGEACEALDGCRAILSRSRCCRLGRADPRSCRSGQTARVGRAAEGAPKGKPRLRGAVSARTGRLCRVNGSAGASLSCCGLCAALPISPGRSLRSPRRVPGNPVPVPALSARRGRSSVLPVRPDGTGGSSRRRRPEGQAPLAGRSLGPHGTAVPGQRLCRCPLSCCGLCAALPISPGRSLRSPTGAGRWRSVPGLSASAGVPIFDADAVSLGALRSVCLALPFRSAPSFFFILNKWRSLLVLLVLIVQAKIAERKQWLAALSVTYGADQVTYGAGEVTNGAEIAH